MNNFMKKLYEMREYTQNIQVSGLDDLFIEKFLHKDQLLSQVIDQAYKEHHRLRRNYNDLLLSPEHLQVQYLQKNILNFYHPETINPYVPLAALGPWIITSCGGVIHDSGGYGMLCWGHAPQNILDVMANPHVMANVMTAQFIQEEFITLLKEQIGFKRSSNVNPYSSFICLNSGSESVGLALRLADLNTQNLIKKGRVNLKKQKKKFLTLSKSFHGRTDKPARVSDSSIRLYRKYLPSFSAEDDLLTVPINDCEVLTNLFERAKQEDYFFEAVIMEPVMGEGNPGLALTPEFYSLVRKLSLEQESILCIDSIQAALRTHGCLSICDYPGFEDLDPPDLETYSKALNAGQYPLSILAVSERVEKQYITGLYGNTMTTNPKALEVALLTLKQMTESVRKNIPKAGLSLLNKLKSLQEKYPQLILNVQGTGLLVSCLINSQKVDVVAEKGLEHELRCNGLGIIHGGENCLRLTPHFRLSEDEIVMISKVLENVLLKYS